jgi:dynactin 1
MPAPPAPPLDPSGLSDTEEDESEAELIETTNAYRPTLRTLATETKMLYRDVLRYSSSPKVVDLSVLQKKREEADHKKTWLPRKKTPAYQVYDRKIKGEKLGRRVKDLIERASVIETL